MGPNISDQASGVFFGAFALIAATTASIMSGAVIERIQTVGFVILALILGSFAWVVTDAWGGMQMVGWSLSLAFMTLAPRALCTQLPDFCAGCFDQSGITDWQVQCRWQRQPNRGL